MLDSGIDKACLDGLLSRGAIEVNIPGGHGWDLLFCTPIMGIIPSLSESDKILSVEVYRQLNPNGKLNCHIRWRSSGLRILA